MVCNSAKIVCPEENDNKKTATEKPLFKKKFSPLQQLFLILFLLVSFAEFLKIFYIKKKFKISF
jgi:hypothetical protein